MATALDVLYREHRAIAAVLHTLNHVVKEVREQQLEPEFAFFHAVIQYMREFPERFHHPKEEEFLFKALRARAPEMAPILDNLLDQHFEGARHLAGLEWKLDDWQKAPNDDTCKAAFCEAATAYAEFQRQHAVEEEATVMPEAKKRLSSQDWLPINEAFSDNDDPLFGDRPRHTYYKLFNSIVRLAPSPWGLAERQSPKTEKAGGL